MKKNIQQLIVISIIIGFTISSIMMAANQTVTNKNNSGAGSLRQAIIDASDGDEITFNLASGNETITISSQLEINESLTINGSNTTGSGTVVTVQVTIPGTSAWRVFYVNASTKTITISNITIKGGNISNNRGGGINHTGGTLNLDYVTVSDSKTTSFGGGIYSTGTITIKNCTISQNSGNFGGGITCLTTATIENCTFTQNTSTQSGGAIYCEGSATIENCTFSQNTSTNIGGAICCAASATIENCTVSQNTSTSSGGGIYMENGGGFGNILNIRNTILVNNTPNDFHYAGGGFGTPATLNDNGYNVVEYQSGDETGSGKTFTATTNILYNTKADGTTGYTTWNKNNADLANQDLNLSSTLADNSTTNGTQTLALTAGSFIIDAGSDIGAPTADQRGTSRIGTTDIGAFEFDGALPVELTTFSVSILGNTVQLNWETATEVNNYGFNVERSSFRKDGTTPVRTEWKNIGFIEGHGNSNSPKLYNYIDNSIEAFGSYLFRLKQIDIDGMFEYSDEVEVSIGTPNKFELMQNYPNPFNPTTTIKYSVPNVASNFSSSVMLKVYDVLGKEVVTLVNQKQNAGRYNVEFNATNLPSGIYFYSINIDGNILSKKMMLIK
ncbi:MAG: choice-of-anchor Q domain-containing protein [Melioribacteraceae bacterium]